MATPPATFSIGNVINNTFGLIARNAVVFLGLSIVMIALPQILAVYVVTKPGLSANVAEYTSAAVLIAVLYYLAFVLLYVLLQSVIMIFSVRDLSGERVDIRQCIGEAVRKLPGLIGLFIVMALAGLAIAALGFMPLFLFSLGRVTETSDAGAIAMAFGGMIFLFIGFVALYLMWMVAIPAKVVENVGVLGALGRSRHLTKGARLRLFGLICVFILFSIILAIPFGMLSLAGSTASTVAEALSSAISTAIGSAGIAAVYIELRGAKEGTSSDQLASVFA